MSRNQIRLRLRKRRSRRRALDQRDLRLIAVTIRAYYAWLRQRRANGEVD